MIFKGEPFAYIHISTKRVKKRMKTRGVQFDENGFYETEKEDLIRILSDRYEVAQEATERHKSVLTPDVIEEPTEEIKTELKCCKKCDFKCDNQGELLAHYKSEHPKNKEGK